MPISPRYLNGLHVSVYPTVETMRTAYLQERYRDFPHEARMRIGPMPAAQSGASEMELAMLAQYRPTAHAVVIVPRKIVLLRFARRATLDDLTRLEYERDLVRRTPELAPASHWPCEARLVYCDIVARVEAAAGARDITLALFEPPLCHAWKSRGSAANQNPFTIRRLSADRVFVYVAECTRPVHTEADSTQSAQAMPGQFPLLTPEQRSARTSKAMRTRWSRIKPEERSAINRQRGSRLWGTMTRDERVDLGRRLNEAKRSKRAMGTTTIVVT